MFAQNIKVFTGCIIGIIGFAGVAAGDIWDPGDDLSAGAVLLPAPTLTVQTHDDHTLSSSTDEVDWFKITLAAGVTYQFEATGSSDTEGWLYSNPAGSAELFNADEGEALNFLLVYTPMSSGPYYIKVEEWFNGDAQYDLSYRIALDDWDPVDDTGAGAVFRPMGESAHNEGPHSLTETDSSDWYHFRLEAGNTYRFETVTEQASEDWNTYGRLYSDSAGSNEVAADDQGGAANNFKLDYTPTVAGDYYLQVVQTNNPVAYAEYDLNYRLIEDEWDPSDDTGNGGTQLSPIDETLRKHGPHALSTTDEYDWFKVHLIAGDTYSFQSTGNSDPEGYLFSDSSGSTTNAYNDDFQPSVDSNFRIIYTPVSSGNYFLLVKHSTTGQDAIYHLNYSVGGDADDDGMPDTWEIAYFGGTNAQPYAHGDSDTQYNVEEYIAGTDPTNPASYFKVTNSLEDAFVIQWFSVAGREYRINWTEELTNGFQQIGPMIDYPQNSYTDTLHSTDSQGYYTVEVKLK